MASFRVGLPFEISFGQMGAPGAPPKFEAGTDETRVRRVDAGAACWMILSFFIDLEIG